MRRGKEVSTEKESQEVTYKLDSNSRPYLPLREDAEAES